MNYKEILENSPIPFLLADAQGLFLEANIAAYNLFNYPSGEITGMSTRKLILKKETTEHQNNLLHDKSEKSFKGLGIKKNGDTFPIEYKTWAIPVTDKQNNTAITVLKSQDTCISESKQNDHSGKKDAFQFSRLFWENPSAGWIVEKESLKFLEVNKTAIHHYGYSKEEFLTKTIYDLLPPSEIKRLKEALKETNDLSQAYTGRWKNTLKNGKIIDVDIPVTIMDSSDNLILLAIDITEQLINEAAKKRERLNIDPLINSTLDQIFSIDINYKLIAANKSFIKLMKEATGETVKIGDDLSEYPFTKGFISLLNLQVKKALKGERIKEIIHLPAYGNLPESWVELFINTIFDGDKSVGTVFYARNITERVLNIKKIKDSEANLAAAQRLANLGNWSKDLITGELKWSDQLYEIFGMKKDQTSRIIGSFLNQLESTKKVELLEAMRRTRKTGESYTLIYPITTLKGEKKIIEENGYGRKNEQGEVIEIFGTAQDITNKMLTEEALRLSIENFNLVSKATNDAVWDWDIEKNIVTRSGDGFKILFGYNNDFANDPDIIYKKLIHPEDIAFVQQSQESVFQNPKENYWEQEYRFLKDDGNYAYVYDRGYIVRDEKGKVKRMIGASQDITLQKKHLNEIERIKGNLQAVINTTEDLIWSVDVNLKIITANKAFMHFMQHLFPDGVKEGDEVISSVPEERIANLWTGFYDRALKGERFSVEYDVHHKQLNLYKFYIISFSPIFNNEGSLTGTACFARDITELKISAEELRQSQNRFKDLFHLSPQPMWLYEKDTLKIVEINKAAIQHYGYSENEFLAMTIMDIRPKEDIAKIKKIISNRRAGVAPDLNEVFRHLKKNKELIEVQIYSTPLEIDDKEYTLVVAIDITEKRKYENNINKAIIKAQENERFEIGSELHDNICQLLASSKMRISLLKEYIPEEKMKLFEESKDFIVIALEEIRNLSHRLAPSFFNDKTLEEAFNKLFHSFNFLKKYSIKLDFSEAVLKQHVSLELKLNLYRILQEQLKNIIKYAHATEINVTVKLVENYITMSITDNGVGFKKEDIKSGIGLSNMQRRAELFSGEFNITSVPGKGTQVFVVVPMESF